jgi:hypothetical protein
VRNKEKLKTFRAELSVQKPAAVAAMQVMPIFNGRHQLGLAGGLHNVGSFLM